MSLFYELRKQSFKSKVRIYKNRRATKISDRDREIKDRDNDYIATGAILVAKWVVKLCRFTASHGGDSLDIQVPVPGCVKYEDIPEFMSRVKLYLRHHGLDVSIGTDRDVRMVMYWTDIDDDDYGCDGGGERIAARILAENL